MNVQSIAIAIFTIILSSSTVIARDYDDTRYYSDAYQNHNDKNVITFYEKCDFEGEHISLPVGNYPSLNELKIGNDRISSVRVPKGMSVNLFSDRRFRGSKLTLDEDLFCLPKRLNNTTSSIVINHNSHQLNHPNPPHLNKPLRTNANVTLANVTAVETSIGLLKLTNKNTWVLETQNQKQRYKELKRDRNGVHLKQIGQPGKLTINLAHKKLELSSAQLNYPVALPIINSWSDPAYLRQSPTTSTASTDTGKQPSRRINGPCFKYKAYTSGGPGGLRFYGKKDLQRLTSKPISGKICADGKITMEMNKNNPDTTVYVEINGKRFSFNAGDKGHAYVNTWYRKHVRLVMQ